jgi:hypothetical protein
MLQVSYLGWGRVLTPKMLSLVVTDITYLSDTFIAHFLVPQQTTPLGLHYPQHKCFSDHHLLEPLFNVTPELNTVP